MRQLKLYARFIIVYLKCKMEYRFAFCMDLFVQIFGYSMTFYTIWILLSKFELIQGWGLYEVIFLYNLNLFTYALSGMFFKHPLLDLEMMIQSGEFDGILIKPMNPLLHLISRQFQHAFLGHIILCVIVFMFALPNLSIIWSPENVAWFSLFVVGATLIHSAIMILAGSVSFWTVKSTRIVEMAIYDLRSFLDYPLVIYQKWVQVLLTFIIPFAFVNFYPAQYFFNIDGSSLFHPVLRYGTPLVGIVLFILSYLLWRTGINKYQSTGS